MTTSEAGIKFIEGHEGYAAQVYNDNGKQAIGYGHDLLPGESFPDGVTLAEAEALLVSDLSARFEPAVNALVPPDCAQNQFDALVDFAYNLGEQSLKTMLGHGWDQVSTQILRWNHVNGQVSAGLTARRQAEVDLFQQA